MQKKTVQVVLEKGIWEDKGNSISVRENYMKHGMIEEEKKPIC